MRYRGIFITFEGSEGSGKSTQIRFVASYFKKKGRTPLVVREPGSTRISEAIRSVLLNPRYRHMSQATELLLYLAARAQLVREKIVPALKAGRVVIADRFEDSTIAYQGFGGGVPLKKIAFFSSFVRGTLKPDLTFVLDVNPQKGLQRGGRHDRVERKSHAFHQRVRRGFQVLARQNKKRMVLISTDQPIKEVQTQIQKHLRKIYG